MLRRLLAVPLFAAALGAQARSLDYPELLRRTSEFDWLWQPAPTGERCVQFSSRDPKSDRGPAAGEDWYANDDRGHYLRVVDGGADREFVLADCDGPGCIARLWSANPSGRIHFDIDGARVWSVDFAQLCAGKLDGLGEPFCGTHARGANCWLPIPFGRHLTVSATAGDLYYHVDVVRFAPGTSVPSFAPELLVRHRADLADAAARLRRPTPEPLTEAPAPRARVAIPPQRIVRSVQLRPCAGAPRGPQLGDLLRELLLVVRCGDEETVRVPVGDFFVCGDDWRLHTGALLGVEEVAWCRYPMPMPEGGVVELVRDDGRAPTADAAPFRLHVDSEPIAFAAPPLRFRAAYHLRKGFASRPFHDHLVLAATGAGRFVGASLRVKNPTRGWWGEGDEKFTVDGEAFPSWFGTGTEDYFGYAWCDPTLFAAPFHAQVQCDGPESYGTTALFRAHVVDSVPFAHSFRFDLEVWHWVPDRRCDFASVAYWYGAPGATSGVPALPVAAARRIEPLPPLPVFVAENALEGEDFRVVSCSGGVHEVQDLGGLEQQFSRDRQRWWRDGKPGDELVLEVPVPAAGRYRVRAAFCTANDYGIVRLRFGGQPLGSPFDGYAPRVGSSGPIALGDVTLPAGPSELRIQITGANAKAQPRRMFGLDYLVLEPLP